ncbi:MAG: isochorismatase family protein [Desulfarculaceae bacterium]|jgi:isochorismate hydrolase
MLADSTLLKTDQCLLVVIDAQERLMPVIWEKERVTQNIVRLVKFAKIVGLPVVLTEQQKLGSTLPIVANELPQVQAVSKISFDCFACPAFLKALETHQRKVLLLAGVEAHICVMQTAISGLADYQIQIVSDAVSSRSKHNWKVALDRLRGSKAVVTSTEMVIYELLGRAGTEEFKAALPLVK